MKRKRIHLSLLLIFAIVISLVSSINVQVEAASKLKLKASKITLYTDSSDYSISFKGSTKKYKISYTSSDKNIVTVSNKGKVKPIGTGIAEVTVKAVKSKKTTTLKAVFTVLERDKKETKDYDKLAADRISELKKSATDKSDTIVKTVRPIISSVQELEEKIYSIGASFYTTINFFIDNFDILRSEQEYLDKYPGISSLKFGNVTIYNNAIEIIAELDYSECGGFKDEYAIECALSNGITKYMDPDTKSLYDLVISLSKKLKGKTEYDTVKNIHDHLVLNIAYPASWSGLGVHSLKNALVEKCCVCDGYAKAFYFLCKASGIKSILVRGDATNSSGITESHAWNKVRIDGKWYAIDVTWDDPFPDVPGQVRTLYFLVTDKDLAKNHIWDNSSLPGANSKDLGIVYKEYGNLPTITGADEVKNYIETKVSDSWDLHFSVEIEFIESSGDNKVSDLIKSLLNDYYSKYNCSYNYAHEGLGFLGRLYKLVLKR